VTDSGMPMAQDKNVRMCVLNAIDRLRVSTLAPLQKRGAGRALS
jgi:hypothetical protein